MEKASSFPIAACLPVIRVVTYGDTDVRYPFQAYVYEEVHASTADREGAVDPGELVLCDVEHKQISFESRLSCAKSGDW